MARRGRPLFSKDTPVVLKPVYRMESANELINIYEFDVVLEQESGTHSTNGTVQFQLASPAWFAVLS